MQVHQGLRGSVGSRCFWHLISYQKLQLRNDNAGQSSGSPPMVCPSVPDIPNIILPIQKKCCRKLYPGLEHGRFMPHFHRPGLLRFILPSQACSFTSISISSLPTSLLFLFFRFIGIQFWARLLAKYRSRRKSKGSKDMVNLNSRSDKS